ncbi:S1C family serine protease [Vulgatibacter incomptus]|uniref:Trypsin-like serine protease n=1 Tax=Vulgatibacter incomptus TaxID=1391653 RepID=A0A0K1PEQ7_9BACT|nr:serine protease [Vulgatibacter incomptus]AKU92018.1 Trypsin-like serine protease [Vulgatibacter incomptus]
MSRGASSAPTIWRSPRTLGALAALASVLTASGVPTSSRGDALAELERQQQELFQLVAPSVVFISRGDALGSGFFVSDSGLILTNAHVVGKSKTVTVLLNDGARLQGEVVERAADDVDLALVQVGIRGTRPLPLGGGSLQVGSWVASVGHGLGGAWTFTTGMVSNIYPLGAERPVFQTQIPLNPGNSGGPVVDRAGRVVGIVTAGIEKSNNVNFAIRVELALQKLAGLAPFCNCLLIEIPAGTPVYVDGKLAGKGPRILVPASAPHRFRIQAVIGTAMRELEAAWPEERIIKLE